jgi:two-component system, LytTR family, response regulator
MPALTTIIIDDEQQCVDVLKAMLQQKFAGKITVVAEATSAAEGKALIKKLKPGLVFLDVEMPVQTGIDLLMELDRIDFEVIFTTAHEQYALRAIKLNALDYLLKPFSIEELGAALDKCLQKKAAALNQEAIHALISNLKTVSPEQKKVGLPTQHGIRFVLIRDIVRIESDSNYSHFFFADGSRMVVSKTLKEFDEILSPYQFFRVHNSHLINIAHLQSFVSRGGDHVVMNDGSKIEVSRRRKTDLMELLKSI